MRIQPVSRYPLPDYPTMAAAQQVPELLCRIPGRWQNSPKFATLLGLVAGLTARVVLAGESPAKAVDAGPAVTQSPDAAPASEKSRASREVQRTTSIVAPLLDEALKYDGRGAFGCVAINPPTFLSEDEALELIRTELEAAGLKLTEDVELDNVLSPKGSAITPLSGQENEEQENEEEDGKKSSPVERDFTRGRPAKLAPGKFVFDLADTHRQVFIEYLSHRDHTDWSGHSMSTVSSYDFPELAQRVASAFQKRPSDTNTVYGVFFDPLARAEVPAPNISGVSAAQRRLSSDEHRKAMQKEYETLGDKAREKLRRQVQNFVVFLRQEGLLTKAN